MKYHGSVKPYTERGIRRVPCVKCGQKSKYQWSICANKNRSLGVCTDCDIELNRIFLEFANFPNKDELLQAYAESKKDTQRDTRKDAKTAKRSQKERNRLGI